MVELQGSRLLLRELSPADLPGIHAYSIEPEVVRFQAWGPNTPEESRVYLRQVIEAAAEEPRVDYTLGLHAPNDPLIVGTVSLKLHSIEHRQGELGYMLHPRAWGQGYATEAARLLVGYGFSSLSLHRVFATVDPRNPASIQVLEKLGMRLEGRQRDVMLLRDGWRDSLLYCVLEDEWRALWPGVSAAAMLSE